MRTLPSALIDALDERAKTDQRRRAEAFTFRLADMQGRHAAQGTARSGPYLGDVLVATDLEYRARVAMLWRLWKKALQANGYLAPRRREEIRVLLLDRLQPFTQDIGPAFRERYLVKDESEKERQIERLESEARIALGREVDFAVWLHTERVKRDTKVSLAGGFATGLAVVVATAIMESFFPSGATERPRPSSDAPPAPASSPSLRESGAPRSAPWTDPPLPEALLGRGEGRQAL